MLFVSFCINNCIQLIAKLLKEVMFYYIQTSQPPMMLIVKRMIFLLLLDTDSCWETITESWLDSDEYSEEMENVSFICSCALNSINDGGSVLIPIGRPIVMLKLLEHVSLSLESSNLKI
nr:uncharacterized protein LOC117281676 [Nicotiana tomentosiformis]